MSCSESYNADISVVNARIYTVDSVQTTVTAMAIKEGKIIALDSDEEIKRLYTAKRIIDAGGKPIFPGFIDSHCHFYGLGLSLVSKVDLVGSLSFEEVIERTRTYGEQYNPVWIQGRGWDQNLWKEKKFPDKIKLDQAFPDIPVILVRIDGHAAIVNSEALRRAGIDGKTKVKGGDIILKNGEPTGVLIDNAIELVNIAIPAPAEKLNRDALIKAQQVCFSYGLTSLTDAGLENDIIHLLQKMYKSGEMKIRINAMISPTQANFDEFMKHGVLEDDFFSIHSVKLYADGALGSRGAKLLEPYSDDPGNSGLSLIDQNTFDSICSLALKYNYQVNTHAIGDSAVRMVLQTYARFLQKQNDRRWRIEHSQVVAPDDFHLFSDYSIIPSVQPTHATSDMGWAADRLGSLRIAGAYAYKELLNQNGWLPLGTDFPIENVNPMLTLYAAVTRKDIQGNPPEGFQIKNALTLAEALQGITIWSARADFNEHKTGSLQVGKCADFVILEQDIFTTEPHRIPQIRVLSTYIGGACVFEQSY